MTAPALLREMHDEASQKWPSLVVPMDEYQHFCDRIAAGRALGELRPYAADLYLCCACIHHDPLALELFKREAEQVVRGAIARVHRESEFVRETLQKFWKKMLAGSGAKVNDYGGRGPLHAWLRIAAARLALDCHKADRAVQDRETDLGDCVAEQVFGPESTLTRERFHAPFSDALRDALGALSHKERNLLRMHVKGRCSIDQIGRMYGVHRATAARWLEQIKGRILDDVRSRLELAGPRLSDSEFRSVARIVGGELDIELSAVPSESPVQPRSSRR